MDESQQEQTQKSYSEYVAEVNKHPEELRAALQRQRLKEVVKDHGDEVIEQYEKYSDQLEATGFPIKDAAEASQLELIAADEVRRRHEPAPSPQRFEMPDLSQVIGSKEWREGRQDDPRQVWAEQHEEEINQVSESLERGGKKADEGSTETEYQADTHGEVANELAQYLHFINPNKWNDENVDRNPKLRGQFAKWARTLWDSTRRNDSSMDFLKSQLLLRRNQMAQPAGQ